jgi:integrase
MSQNYQHGYLRRAKRKSGPHCWEFLWRENDTTGKRIRRTAIIGTVEQYPTEELALLAANGLRMQINVDRNRYGKRQPNTTGRAIGSSPALEMAAKTPSGQVLCSRR